jgi:hypothetical protein
MDVLVVTNSSVAPSPSVLSLHEGQAGAEGAEGVASPPAAAAAAGEDAACQLT